MNDESNIVNGFMINKLKIRTFKLASFQDKKKDKKQMA